MHLVNHGDTLDVLLTQEDYDQFRAYDPPVKFRPAIIFHDESNINEAASCEVLLQLLPDAGGVEAERLPEPSNHCETCEAHPWRIRTPWSKVLIWPGSTMMKLAEFAVSQYREATA